MYVSLSELIKKIKESDFGKKISDMFKGATTKLGNFLLGDMVDGKRQNGLFSETVNSLSDIQWLKQ